MRQTIDGAAFQRMMLSAAASIEIQKQQINELNVFPVPDGDTGTNMSMTMSTAAGDLRKLDAPSLSKAADTAASALLRGARGNSGVILSLLFRGFSKSLKGKKELNGAGFAEALGNGVRVAYKAVMKPAEGTILTVTRVTAEACAGEAKQDDAIEHIVDYAVTASKAALADTVHQNPVLDKAGVVDAGGMGFVAILEGMLASLRGHDLSSGVSAEQTGADFAALSAEDITFTFDTVFIVKKDEDKPLDLLRAYLGTIGDSLVIGEDDDRFKVHVHTDVPGIALTEAQKYGTLELAKIENMRAQYEDMATGRRPRSTDDLDGDAPLSPPPLEPSAPAVKKKFGVVSICAGEGIEAVFRDLGVDVIVQGGQTMNPSTEDIAKAVAHTPSDVVFVLPNNKNIIMAAEQAVPLSEKQVIVIPSKTVPQGLTAMLAFDPDGELADNTAALTGALDTVTTMQITYAARDSGFDGFHIRKGDYLALCNSALFGTDRSLDALLNGLAQKVADEGKEFVTIFYGKDVEAKKANKALSIFTKRCPHAEVSLLPGGQPVYYYLISAE